MKHVWWPSYASGEPVSAARRRRYDLPRLGLPGSGWEALAAGSTTQPDAAVLDATSPEAELEASRLIARGVPFALDLAGVEDTTPDDENLARLWRLLRLSDTLIVAEAAPPWLPRGARGEPSAVIRIPDAVETKARHAWLSAPSAPAQPAIQADLLWYIEPGDPATKAELSALAKLLPLIRLEGRELTLLVTDEHAGTGLARFQNVPGVSIRRWSAQAQFMALDSAKVVLLPLGNSASALRRARQALACGTAVAAAGGASLSRLGPAIVQDEWSRGIRQDRRMAALARAHAVDAGELPSIAQSAAAWARLLDGLSQPRKPAVLRKAPVRLLIFLDQVTEVDLCEPLILAARGREELDISVAMTTRLADTSPRSRRLLLHAGVRPKTVNRTRVMEGLEPDLSGFDALLAPVTTDHTAHKRSHAVTERAKSLGITTYSMQHGLENLGISYSAPDEPKVSIASDHIIVWFPADHIPDMVPDEMRPKLLHLGSVKPVPLEGPALDAVAPGRRVGIFENLHWNRYDDAYREAFAGNLLHTAQRFPDVSFVMKPHPGGRWTVRGGARSWPSNIVILDPGSAEWELFNAAAIIASLDVVITTPSTVALDGVQGGRPTAVVAGALTELEAFTPLPLLREREDWVRFVATSLSGAPDLLPGARFLRRNLVPGLAASRMLDAIIARGR